MPPFEIKQKPHWVLSGNESEIPAVGNVQIKHGVRWTFEQNDFPGLLQTGPNKNVASTLQHLAHYKLQ